MILPNMNRVSQAPESRLYLIKRVQLLLLIGCKRQALFVLVWKHHVQLCFQCFYPSRAPFMPFPSFCRSIFQKIRGLFSSLHFIWIWRWSWVMWGSHFWHCHDFSPGDGQKQSHAKSMGHRWSMVVRHAVGSLENRLLTMMRIPNLYVFLCMLPFLRRMLHQYAQYGVPNVYERIKNHISRRYFAWDCLGCEKGDMLRDQAL